MTMPKLLNNTQIKYLAAFFMLLDHLALIVLPEQNLIYFFLRSIGRLAAPIFFWGISEGAWHTKNEKKYLVKILIFALAFQLIYMQVLGESINLINIFLSYKNIFFTLALGLAAIIVIKKNSESKVLMLISILLFPILGQIINVDYGWYGVLTIIFFYIFRKDNLKLIIAIILSNAGHFFFNIGKLPLIWNSIQLLSILSLFIIFLYNGERGKGSKYFFYVFYPAHLIILYAISYFL